MLLESSKKVQSLNYTKSFHFFPFWGLRAVWPVLYFHLSSRSLRFFDAILADIFKKTKMTCVQIFEDISFSKFQKYLYLSVVSEWTQEISKSNLGGGGLLPTNFENTWVLKSDKVWSRLNWKQKCYISMQNFDWTPS